MFICRGVYLTVEREFSADVELKSLYLVYLATMLLGGFLWWMIPVVAYVLFLSVEVGVVLAVALFAPVFIAATFVLYWIPKFQSSINYIIEDDKITVMKGVWWKNKSFVPYNRITNVSIYQGPISRRFGLGKLSIQTAGFSSVGGGGVKNFEEVKDLVMEFVKGLKPQAVEAEAERKPTEDMNQLILVELRKIRKALER
jgi:membrane protein YdbS with pleckstrin-like domain